MNQPQSSRVDFDKVAQNYRKLQDALTGSAENLGMPIEPAVLPSSTPKATVVVVGEPKGGKSSLVNALVEYPNLSPVDYAVATATYISIQHGTAGALVFPDGYDDPEEIHLDELPAWTSVEGLAANPRAPRVPKPVAVSLPATMLERLNLIDTPGVGGFDSADDRSTLDALAAATTLVFVADGSRPISEPEMAFLEQATRRVAAVTFVLTKIDQLPEWEAVLADNRAKIGARIPDLGDMPWFPVSATLAETARTSNLPPDAARQLREQSRIDPLLTFLRTDVAAQARLLVTANVFKDLKTIAGGLLPAAQARASILEDPSENAAEDLAAEASELRDLSSKEDAWRTRLELNLTTLRSANMLKVDQFVRSAADEWVTMAKDRSVSPDQLTDVVNRGIAAASMEMAEQVEAKVEAEIRGIIGDAIESPAFAAALATAAESKEVVDLRDGRVLIAEGRIAPGETYGLATAGTGVLSMAIGVGGLSWYTGAGLAVAAVATAVLFARRQAQVNERVAWVNSRLVEAKLDMQAVNDHRVQTTRMLAQNAVRDWIRVRKAELEATLVAHQHQMRATKAEQDKAVLDAKAAATLVEQVITGCDTYIDFLTGQLWSSDGKSSPT